MTRLYHLRAHVLSCGTCWLVFLAVLTHVGSASRDGAHADDGLATDTEPPAPSRHVRIVVGFDGSCPHDPAGVKEEGEARFRVFPSWRYTPGIDEEAVGRSTRLGFKVVNTGQSSKSVDLLIDWQYHDAPPKDRPNFASVGHYMSYRDFVVVQWPKSEKWHTIMADVEDSVAHIRLNAPPGATEIHWHPPYNYAQSEQFVKSLRDQPLVKVEKIGESPEGRNLWLLRITDPSPRSKKNFLSLEKGELATPYEP